MRHINEVTNEDIFRLNKETLPKVLHNLLINEGKTKNLEEFDFMVPFNIDSPDAGNDGRAQFKGKIPSNCKFKTNYSIYQSKATNLRVGDCEAEIISSGTTLKRELEILANKNGSYILFTNQKLVDDTINRKIAAFRAAFIKSNHKNKDTINIDVFDANKIKDWVNQYIGSIAFVHSILGNPRPAGLLTWIEWSEQNGAKANKFQANDKLHELTKTIRENIIEEKVMRLHGHSGLGKTRMIIETFRNSELKEQLVFYDLNGRVDLSEIQNYINTVRLHQEGIFVIENCDVKQHLILSSLVREIGNIKILTIGIEDSQSIDDIKLKLDRKDLYDVVNNIVEEKLTKRFDDNDKSYIASLSEGNPWMAIRFCDYANSESTQKLAEIPIEQFLEKMLSRDSIEEYGVLRACSLFSSFGFADNSYRNVIHSAIFKSLEDQSKFIRENIFDGEITETRFNEIILKYKNQDIIERRGYYHIVRPSILGIYLAADWLKVTSHSKAISVIEKLKDVKLEIKFSERLRDLDQIERAKELVEELWGPYSPFGKAEVIKTGWGSLLFRNIVDVNPEIAISTLNHIYKEKPINELREELNNRRNLVVALEKLAFRNETFIPAVKILLKFAVAETENYGNNSSAQFAQLFQTHLGGTQASYEKRIEILKWGLSKNNSDYDKIIIKAISSGLSMDRLMRMMGSERQGSSAPLKEFEPKTWGEIFSYWTEQIEILTELILKQGEYLEEAKTVFCDSIYTFLKYNKFQIIEPELKRISEKISFWPEMVDALRRSKSFIKKLTFDTIKEIEEIIKLYEFNNLEENISRVITNTEWEIQRKDSNGRFVNYPKINAESFADKIVKQEIDLSPYYNSLLSKRHQNLSYFGSRLGELDYNKETFLDNLLDELSKIDKENQNSELIRSYLIGRGNKSLFKRTIRRIISDPLLKHLAFNVIQNDIADLEDIELLLDLIDSTDIPPEYLYDLSYSAPLRNLNHKDRKRLIEKLFKYEKTGKWIALDFLHSYSYTFGDFSILDPYIDECYKIICESNLLDYKPSLRSTQISNWVHTARYLVDLGSFQDLPKLVLKNIVEIIKKANYMTSLNTSLENLVRYLFDHFFEESWNQFSSLIIGTNSQYINVKGILGSSNGLSTIYNIGIPFLKNSDYPYILNWIKENKPLAPIRIISMLPVVNSGNETEWNPLTYQVIDLYGNNDDFFSSLESHIQTFGGSGSMIPYHQSISNLMNKLVDHRSDIVSNWAKKMISRAEKRIKEITIEDENW